MTLIEKVNNPFNPSHPVPVELFTGRAPEIERVMQRGVGQTARGKPTEFFIQGEYGIGKSSIAGYLQRRAETEYQLQPIQATLAAAATLDDIAAAVLQGTIQSGALAPSRTEIIRNWLADFIGKQDLFGVTLNLDKIKRTAPSLASFYQILDFLREVHARLKGAGNRGIFLLFDEINGIAAKPLFAHFLKGMVDINAMSPAPVPFVLMLCGTEERRRQLISCHEPVARIFDVIIIDPMSDDEVRDFFERAFTSVRMSVRPEAMDLLVEYTAGYPKIMHALGDAAYWLDRDGVIDADDATRALAVAAEEIGRKFIDQQVYKALQSKDYLDILMKVGRSVLVTFSRKEVEQRLSEAQKKKFGSFLRRMRTLNVIRPTGFRGEYEFTHRMIPFYLRLRTTRRK